MSWKEEILMDYQGGNLELGPAEKKMMDLVTKIVAGTVVVWCTANELLNELTSYRNRRNRKVTE